MKYLLLLPLLFIVPQQGKPPEEVLCCDREYVYIAASCNPIFSTDYTVPVGKELHIVGHIRNDRDAFELGEHEIIINNTDVFPVRGGTLQRYASP